MMREQAEDRQTDNNNERKDAEVHLSVMRLEGKSNNEGQGLSIFQGSNINYKVRGAVHMFLLSNRESLSWKG